VKEQDKKNFIDLISKLEISVENLSKRLLKLETIIKKSGIEKISEKRINKEFFLGPDSEDGEGSTEVPSN